MTERITIEVEYEIEYGSEHARGAALDIAVFELPRSKEKSTYAGWVKIERMNTKLKGEK